MSTLFSVLVATVADRRVKLGRLLSVLEPQVLARRDVELLLLPDMRVMSIGDKRNLLTELSSGEYVAFVDDDDAVTTDYVSSITAVLARDKPDVLCFQVRVMGYGDAKICRYHPSFEHRNLIDGYLRKPNHLMPWRRSLACRIKFPSTSFGEDTDWANRMNGLARRVSVIDRPLYSYQYDRRDNSTLKRKK